jgi:hypothetical protein
LYLEHGRRGLSGRGGYGRGEDSRVRGDDGRRGWYPGLVLVLILDINYTPGDAEAAVIVWIDGRRNGCCSRYHGAGELYDAITTVRLGAGMVRLL